MKKNIIIIMALLLACAFAVPVAYADQAPENASGTTVEKQGAAGQSSQEQNQLQAILYDDGELVISNAPNGCGNSGNASNANDPNSAGNANDSGSGGNDSNGSSGSGSNDPCNAGDSNKSNNGESAASGGPGGPANRVPANATNNAGDPGNAAGTATGGATGNALLGAPGQTNTPPTRTAVARYDNIAASIYGPGQVPWYENRDLISSVSFGEGVAPETMAHWFAGLSNLTGVNFAGLDASQVTSMHSMFSNCVSMKQIDMKGLNTSQVTDMSRLFANCSSLQSINLLGLDTRNVTTMDSMFEGCRSVSLLDLSGLDTRNVKSTKNMLKGCTSLAALDVSSFSPDQVRAMSVPVDNKGGFWRLNVPKGYDAGVVLRPPTEAERIAAGLGPLFPDNGTHGKGSVVPTKKNPIATIGNRIGLMSLVPSAVVPGSSIFGFVLASQGIMETASVVPTSDNGLNAEEAARAAIGRIALVNEVLNALRVNPGEMDSGEGTLGLALDGAAAFVDAIVTPSPTNPMTPLGIPLNLLAIAILLFITVPMTVLVLRDNR